MLSLLARDSYWCMQWSYLSFTSTHQYEVDPWIMDWLVRKTVPSAVENIASGCHNVNIFNGDENKWLPYIASIFNWDQNKWLPYCKHFQLRPEQVTAILQAFSIETRTSDCHIASIFNWDQNKWLSYCKHFQLRPEQVTVILQAFSIETRTSDCHIASIFNWDQNKWLTYYKHFQLRPEQVTAISQTFSIETRTSDCHIASIFNWDQNKWLSYCKHFQLRPEQVTAISQTFSIETRTSDCHIASIFNWDQNKWRSYCKHFQLRPEQVTAILQTYSWVFSNESSMSFDLFPRIQMTKSRHCFRFWLGAAQMSMHYLNQWWPSSLICWPQNMTESCYNTVISKQAPGHQQPSGWLDWDSSVTCIMSYKIAWHLCFGEVGRIVTNRQ